MLAYARASQPCSEATDIGYILSGGSGCFNSANLLKNLWKKTGEIEIIREIKSLRIDILLINKKKEYIIGVLLPIIHSQQKYHIFICFDVFSAYYNTIICVSVLQKLNFTGLIQNLIKKSNFQRTTTIIRVNLSKKLHRKPKPSGDSPNHSNNKQQFSFHSQSTAPEESLTPIFVASEQGLDVSA